MIGGDERKVKQVLLNLLSNALKFTPEGGRIDVGARLDGDMAEVSVADTGIGIAPEDQEAVFEEFRQVGTADKKAEGTGLGLALSRKFIELHGGRIWVKSQLGAGLDVQLHAAAFTLSAIDTLSRDRQGRLHQTGDRIRPAAAQMSITTSSCGREQQIRTFPSAGGSSGSGW